MPIVWNSEADAKLLSAIIKVYDVKVGGAKLNEVAAIMGPDCTAKALTHRISKIRTLAKGAGSQGGGDNGTNGAPIAPQKPKAAAAPSTGKKSDGSRKKKAATAEGSDDGEGPEARASTARPKRSTKKRDYAKMANGERDVDDEEREVDGLDKKIKIEVGEDIGEGLRSQ